MATAVSLSVLGAVALVGWPGLVVASGSSFVIFGNTRAKRLVGHSVDAVPAALLLLAAVATLVQFPLGSDALALRFAGDRRWAHELALMSFAFVAALVPLRWLSDRPRGRRGDIEVEPPDPHAVVGDRSAHDEETSAT